MPIVFILMVAVVIPLGILGVATVTWFLAYYVAPFVILGLVGWLGWKAYTANQHANRPLDLSPPAAEIPRREYLQQRIAILDKQERRGMLPPHQATELAALRKELRS